LKGGKTTRFFRQGRPIRSLALEGDESASVNLDTYARTGEDDPIPDLVPCLRTRWQQARFAGAHFVERVPRRRMAADGDHPRRRAGAFGGLEHSEHPPKAWTGGSHPGRLRFQTFRPNHPEPLTDALIGQGKMSIGGGGFGGGGLPAPSEVLQVVGGGIKGSQKQWVDRR
jgi:hypothetical protein